MIVRLIHYALALLLLYLAAKVPVILYLLHGYFGGLFGEPWSYETLLSDMKPGVWVLLVASVFSIVGALGVFLRRNWGRVGATFALGLSVLVELAMVVFPERQLQSWFSFYETRWSAGVEALIFSSGLAWLFSYPGRVQFRQKSVLA